MNNPALTLPLRFARNLRRLRISRGWSRSQLAEEARMSKAFVNKLDDYGDEPIGPMVNASLETVERFAELFGVTAETLIAHPD